MPKQQRAKSLLRLKVRGPHIRPGRIPIPELLVVCQQAQAAVNRQAEALEGRRSLRPGPKTEKVRVECRLELYGIGKGSAILSFDLAKPQPSLPELSGLGEEAVSAVVHLIRDIKTGHANDGIDPGVLSSLNSMGDLLDNGVTAIEWIVPRRAGRKRTVAVFDKSVREHIGERLTPPVAKPVVIDGILEMADFKASDLKCIIHPAVGARTPCSFTQELADDVYRALRQAARIEGIATINAHTGRMENVEISSVTPLDPLTVNAGSFFSGWSFDQLAQMQAIEPLRDFGELAGGWPDDEPVDDILDEIYQRRA